MLTYTLKNLIANTIKISYSVLYLYNIYVSLFLYIKFLFKQLLQDDV